MPDDVPSILSHISLGTNDFDRAIRFYDRVLATLGCGRLFEHPGALDDGEPGPRPEYGEDYYGCFVRDLDGHKIEAATIPSA